MTKLIDFNTKKSGFSIFFIMTTAVVISSVLLTVSILVFYQVKIDEIKQNILINQKNKAEEIANQIENYLIRAQQLSDSAVSLLSSVEEDHSALEDILKKLLRSANDNTIYGIGVWFEPYMFDPQKKYVGPYVHKGKSNQSPIVLTYEWATPSYDYHHPRHEWYQSGKIKPGEHVFNEPYFDGGLVWMTLTQGFFNNQDKFMGAVTVDMILPTVLGLLEKLNNNNHDTVYISTQQNTLFVHPNVEQLLQFTKKYKTVNSILDLTLEDLKFFEAHNNIVPRIESTVTVEHVYWKVHIATDQNVLYRDIYTFKNSIITSLAFLWTAFFIILLLLSYFGKQAKKSRAAQEQLQQELLERRRKADNLQELNTLLENKVAERTEALRCANAEIMALNDKLKCENLRMSNELETTRRLQQLILPRPYELKAISELEIASFMEPATEVGGDYYDVLEQAGHIKIAIGDVTGHGLESGMVMLMVQMAVRVLFNHQVSDPVMFFDRLNQSLYENIKRMHSDKNLTLVLLDYYKGSVQIAGQHEEVLVVRKEGTIERIDTLELGFMVGMVDQISQFIKQTTLYLQPGDGLVLYTDGITEARSPDNRLYGVERLCRIVSQMWPYSANEIQKTVIADVQQHIQNKEQLDDVTLVVLKRCVEAGEH